MSENSVKKKIFLFLLIFAVVLSSFYFLDFKAAQSKTQANSGVSSYSSGNPELDFPGSIHLYIEGDDSLTGYLKEELRKDLEAAGMEVIVVDGIEENYSSQALLVNISRDNWLYTPVYASSKLNLVFFLYFHGSGYRIFRTIQNRKQDSCFYTHRFPSGRKVDGWRSRSAGLHKRDYVFKSLQEASG